VLGNEFLRKANPIIYCNKITQGAKSKQPELNTKMSNNTPHMIPREGKKFEEIFENPGEIEFLPPRRPIDCDIKIEDGIKLPFTNIYNLYYDEQIAQKQYIDKSLISGIITPAVSPIGSPIFFVKKKKGE
jgi:hypothetical protein